MLEENNYNFYTLREAEIWLEQNKFKYSCSYVKKGMGYSKLYKRRNKIKHALITKTNKPFAEVLNEKQWLIECW